VRAISHLQPELACWGYEGKLEALRQMIARKGPAFWAGSLYNCLLAALRTLNAPTTSQAYPPAMHSDAWADKMLHAQLSAWAQMRHDNILYVKQSVTAGIVCEYPAGYVEPYPAFYAAIGEYAALGKALFVGLDARRYGYVRQYTDYFDYLSSVAQKLKGLAERELRQEPFSQEEETWLRGAASREARIQHGCGGPVEVSEYWLGWYSKLFPFRKKDGTPVLIADVHSDPLNSGQVLHVATGKVAATLFLAQSDEGTAMYVGPTFTYYEVVTGGERLTDDQWRQELAATPRPVAPDWTSSFRWSAAPEQETLALPLFDREQRAAHSYKENDTRLVDPWTTVDQRYQVGQIVKGVVTKIAPFGAFARIEDGVEGLIHLSELLPGQDPKTALYEGQELALRILHIDSGRRRLGLSMRQADGIIWPARQG